MTVVTATSFSMNVSKSEIESIFIFFHHMLVCYLIIIIIYEY